MQKAERRFARLGQRRPEGTRFFQQTKGAHHIGLYKLAGAMDRTIHMALRRKVHNGLGLMLLEQCGNDGSVANIGLGKRMSFVVGNAGEITEIARVGERIDVKQGRALAGQPVQHKISTDKPRPTSNQNHDLRCLEYNAMENVDCNKRMPRILLIKTSSLGDIVHNLPVASDIASHVPNAQIDWVVEAPFAAIAQMHPHVAKVIPVALRRWRHDLLSTQTRNEWQAFKSHMNEHCYDAVIDTQGLLKSALLARTANAIKGKRFGLDWASSREPLGLFYDKTFSVPWGQHAVVRNRTLAAMALGYVDYTASTPPVYGITAPMRDLPWLHTTRYAVLLHATSAANKLWPEQAWQELHKYLILNNILSILPWGNDAERARSERLSATMPGAIVPPAMRLDDLAALLSRAQCVVGVDTGLTHFAAALGTPTIGIYVATDPAATGIYGCARAMNLGGIGAAPTAAAVITALESLVTSVKHP